MDLRKTKQKKYKKNNWMQNLKNWELNAEEKSKFREGEQKVLDNIGKMPEKAPERDALDSRDIF